MSGPLIDAAARARAIEDAGASLVVLAGAGTGKTTLLVDRILHLVLGRGLSVRRVVALTFTQKAANEMRVRLLDMLGRVADVLGGRERRPAIVAEVNARVESWQAAFRLKLDQVEERARQAIAELDQALIETIHGFSAHLLRLYPVEARVDPAFEVDPGEGFARLFEKAWARWIEAELAEAAPRGEDWLAVLERIELDVLEQAAHVLSGFAIPLDRLVSGAEEERTAALFRARAEELREALGAARASCTKPAITLNQQLAAYEGILQRWLDQAPAWDHGAAEALEKSPLPPGKAWEAEAGLRAKATAQAARAFLKSLLEVDRELIAKILALLIPFARSFRSRMLAAGMISFDGLLVLARDLVRDHAPVRAALKGAFDAILVDEFQDTDPVQYEVVFFLAERAGDFASDIRQVRLEPGKLFIVGDPKQSIYAFRRADIEAFEEVRRQIEGDCGAVLALEANFRSHSGITHAVNEIFGDLIRPFKRLQVEYRPIHARREPEHAGQEVELVRVAQGEKKILAEAARRGQADFIARWIAEHVGALALPDPRGDLRPLAYKDIALLFRSLSSVHVYLEAFRRARIPYVVEGEKYFYSNQEILDFMNLLCAIENPHDAVAVAGVLRSPVGGLTDGAVFALSELGALDYRKRLPAGAPDRPRLGRLYAHLAALHAGLGRWPLERLFDEIFERTFLLEVTAGSYQGEQKLANLLKLKRMAAEMGREGEATLRRFIALLKERIENSTEEGESPLADETLDAVKILSIHKAKGLEFPVVFLANLHADLPKGTRGECRISYDWTERVVGIDLGGVRNLGSVLLAQKEEERQREEEKRVLYVAMTRARERLVLLGSVDPRPGSPLELMLEVMQEDAAAAGTAEWRRGPARLVSRRVEYDGKPIEAAPEQPDRRERLPNWKAFAATWRERRARIAEAAPSAPTREETHAAQLGTVCHRVLELVDFEAPQVAGLVARACAEVAHAIDPERLAREATEILERFAASEAFGELARAEVLGREVPLLAPDPATKVGVRRTLDVLYREQGRLVIGDYKTEVGMDPEKHRRQGEEYVAAVREMLGVDAVEFRVIFVRGCRVLSLR